MNKKPKIGQTYKVRGVLCKIVKVLPAGTMDVVSPSGNAFRVSGLPFR